jgi:hypothetical protein
MPGKSSPSNRRFEHWRRAGKGPCTQCGAPAKFAYWIKLGAKDEQKLLLCDEHAPRYDATDWRP